MDSLSKSHLEELQNELDNLLDKIENYIDKKKI